MRRDIVSHCATLAAAGPSRYSRPDLVRDRSFFASLAVVGFLGILVVVLQLGLPAATFVAGDSGVKLVAAANALRRPSAPLEIPLPDVGGKPVAFVEPFYRVHGDHRHAVTPEVFPIATAPFLAAFGVRGVYVLPAIGFLLALGAWGWVARLLDPSRAAPLVILTMAFGTPWLFYGLEFWEHAPAVALAGVGTSILVRGPRRGADPAWRALAAGLVLGLATLLRPELSCFVVALLAAGTLTRSWHWSVSSWVCFAAALTWAPTELYALVHFGSLTTPHLAGASGAFEGGWIAGRLSLLETWLVAPSTSNFWRVAPIVLVAPFAFVTSRGRDRQLLALTAAATIGLVVLIAPNDGGAQWGPRYLLVAYAPLAVLASDVLRAIARRGRLGVAIVAITLLAGAWIQRDGYRDLRVAKEIYGRVLAFVRDTTPPGGIVTTDLWWLDQVAAAAADRTFLYAADAGATARLVVTLQDAGVPGFTAILSRDEPHSWLTAAPLPCYAEASRATLPDRALVAIGFRATCR